MLVYWRMGEFFVLGILVYRLWDFLFVLFVDGFLILIGVFFYLM